MYHYKPKLARVDPDNPNMWARCDRCGFVVCIDDMVWQWDYRGTPQPVNTRVLTCGRPTCLDVPQVQNSPIILSPDPEPVFNARPFPYEISEPSWLGTQDGYIIDTQDDENITTNIPNPSADADTAYLRAVFNYIGTLPDNLYLDLFNGSPGTVTSASTQTFTHSTTYIGDVTYSGADGAGNGMRDGLWDAADTVWGSIDANPSYLTADIGAITTVASISVAPILASFEGWGTTYLDNAVVSISSDGSSWTQIGTVSGSVENEYTTITIAQQARYVRLSRDDNEYLGVGDFIVNTLVAGPGVSILRAVTGSAVRSDVAASLTTTARAAPPPDSVATNPDVITISDGSESVTNVNWAGIYTAASGGTLLMVAPISVRDHGNSIGVSTAVVFDDLDLVINLINPADMVTEDGFLMITENGQLMITELGA